MVVCITTLLIIRYGIIRFISQALQYISPPSPDQRRHGEQDLEDCIAVAGVADVQEAPAVRIWEDNEGERLMREGRMGERMIRERIMETRTHSHTHSNHYDQMYTPHDPQQTGRSHL